LIAHPEADSTPNESAYDAIADWYDESIRQGSLLHETVVPALFDLMGDVQGQQVCDLGCGQGTLARETATRGAAVVGIDISERLLGIARQQENEERLGIAYRRDDAQHLTTVPDEAFDGVVCCMALMDIPNLDATLCAVRRVLKPGGWFVFAVTHPCFQMPPSGGYSEERFWRSSNPNGVRGKVGAIHRPLSVYLNSLGRAHLLMERCLEPPGPGREVPAVLAARCTKGE
jgi:ubiquinone/menaquinone biosynthesis C-methylase UbiE